MQQDCCSTHTWQLMLCHTSYALGLLPLPMHWACYHCQCTGPATTANALGLLPLPMRWACYHCQCAGPATTANALGLLPLPMHWACYHCQCAGPATTANALGLLPLPMHWACYHCQTGNVNLHMPRTISGEHSIARVTLRGRRQLMGKVEFHLKCPFRYSEQSSRSRNM